MTGYGTSTHMSDGYGISVEIKSVNHRFLDLNIKMPKVFNPYEDRVRKIISENVSRGHLDVYVSFADNCVSAKKVVVDHGLAKMFVEASDSLSKTLKLKNDFTIQQIMRTPELIKVVSADENADVLAELLFSAVTDALGELNKMREIEGQKLGSDIAEKLCVIRKSVGEIQEKSEFFATEYRAKLTERITEALNGVTLDESRLINEIAFFADKSSIDEELSRLNSHISQLYLFIEGSNPVGRQADFLIQELNREINTVCSKSTNITVTGIALTLKNETEKIREQVQNIE